MQNAHVYTSQEIPNMLFSVIAKKSAGIQIIGNKPKENDQYAANNPTLVRPFLFVFYNGVIGNLNNKRLNCINFNLFVIYNNKSAYLTIRLQSDYICVQQSF